ncbi:MAG: DUF1549 domain-containing protein [Planctomycetes bacterium]|nr:DUF1549 domain-containing protein [Planctomycetota bacterium]
MRAAKLAFLLAAAAGLGASPQDNPLSARIDVEVLAISGVNRTTLSPRCEDGEFLRRVMLDLVGYPPTAEETLTFWADRTPDKRAAKVDQLLASDRFADFWARRWMGVFFGNYHVIRREPMSLLEPEERDRIMERFRNWLRGRLRNDWAWTDTVSDLLTAEGSSDTSPAVAYKLALDAWPRRPYFEGRATSHFLGMDLSCTGCHDDPFDKWRVEDGYGMAAFSNGRSIDRKPQGLVVTEGPEPGNRPVVADKGFIPGSFGNQAVLFPPKFLFGGGPKDGEILARAFARFMVAPENLQFRKGVVNRVWSWLLGRGIVSPVDEFNLRNKPLSPRLLDLLARGFAANGHSLRFLVRAICASEAYQRSCEGATPYMKANFARAQIRPLSAEQILNSLDVAATGRPRLNLDRIQEFAELLSRGDAPACETAERAADPRALAWLSGSGEVRALIRDGAVMRTIRSTGEEAGGRVKLMFLAALSREPSPTELERYAAYLKDRGGEGDYEAYWVLLNSTEFLTRH